MDELNCKVVRGSLWDYATGSLPESDRRGIALHLSACRDCEMHQAEVRSLRTGLKHLPLKHMPPMLGTRLRILASRERSRLLMRRDFHTWLREMRSRAKLFFDNLLKPFAVPAVGGILASCLCFGMIVDTLHVAPDWQDDMPMGLFTEVTIVEPSPFCIGGKDVMVQLTVDSRGNVTDYALPQGAAASPEEMSEIGNLVLYSTFSPATRFGKPVSSKRLFSIRHISIKG